MSTITTPDHVFFYTNYLSNWWSTRDIKPQFIDPISGIAFNNSEESFIWQKARFFGDAETCVKIADHAQARGHPRDVKALGRLVKGYNDKAWDCVREGAMAYSCWLKFSQNPDLAAELKATGDRILVEASPVDRVWGCGLDVEAAAAFAPPGARDEVVWPGRNLLGKALMMVRTLL